MKVQSVAVVGGGSAGFLAALALQRSLPDLPITVIHSEALGIIGVGEATTWAVPTFLHETLQLDRGRFFREVRPAFKGGVRLFWGSRDYFDYTFEGQMTYHPPELPRSVAWYCDEDLRTPSLVHAAMDLGLSPIIRSDYGDHLLAAPIGYHLENEAFVAHLAALARERGVLVLDREVREVQRRDDGGVAALVYADGSEGAFDLFVDCTGFRSRLLRQELGVPFRSYAQSLFCDRAVVGGFPRTDEPVRPYTGVHTQSSGWTFVTEHWDRLNCGYVYSGAFQTDASAEAELRAFCGGKLGQTRIVPYLSGRAERAWEKNVVAIGNSCGFVEPLQSTGLHVICDLSRFLASVLVEAQGEVRPGHQRHFNRLFEDEWEQVRRFLAMHYKLNTRLDTPFWRAARADTDLAGGEEILEAYAECGPASLLEASLDKARGFFGWDGYLTLLLGMRAPTERRAEISAAERAEYRRVLERRLRDAPRALPMREALARVLGGSFRWDGPLAHGLRLHPASFS